MLKQACRARCASSNRRQRPARRHRLHNLLVPVVSGHST